LGVFAFALSTAAVVVGFVRLAVAEGPIYIRADGSVDGTWKIQRDGNVYTFTDDIFTYEWPYGIIIERDNIVIDGAGHILKGHKVDIIEHFSQSKPLTTGISLEGRKNITIKNLQITEFNTGLRGRNCKGIKILCNKITNTVKGLWFLRSSHNILSSNNIIGNSNGIFFESDCFNFIISENNVSDNYYGIKIQLSNNNTISGNHIAKNTYGISIEFSSNYNVVSKNRITNNYNGIGLGSSLGNIVYGNNITNNTKYGVALVSQASHNTFSGNNITKNAAGIYISESSNNNTFHHNNFINNTMQVYDIGAEFPHIPSSVNIWDDGYPSGGNYWSDYTGGDANGDGVGDTPYEIYANNQDNYPLMKPVVLADSPNEETPPNGSSTQKSLNPALPIIAALILLILVICVVAYKKLQSSKTSLGGETKASITRLKNDLTFFRKRK
jgi:parallel beta-helix repeat protein